MGPILTSLRLELSHSARAGGAVRAIACNPKGAE